MNYKFSAPGTSIPDVTVMRGETGPKIEGGYLRLNTVQRPKKKSVTIYDGLDPISLAIPVLFDGWLDREPVQDDFRNIMRMREEIEGEPPAVRVNVGIAGGLPIDANDIDFWMANVEQGENQIWDFNKSGVLVLYRQDAVIHLIEKVDPVVSSLTFAKSGNTRGKSGKGKKHPTRYVSKAGDTLPSIAAHVLKDRSRWREIGRLNGLVDPRAVRLGQTLKLPK